MTSPLSQLHDAGQSIWIDSISRDMLNTGQLAEFIEHKSVTGLTSNPTIFEKAIASGNSYDLAIFELHDSGSSSPLDIAMALFVEDIQRAADILRPSFDAANGKDGFVSLEVPPSLSHDTAATITMAKTLWKSVDRPNLMIKIPATLEGIPAAQQVLTDGINVNFTLIFSLDMYRKVVDAYTAALYARTAAGKPLDIQSVASFFVSRVDTLVDSILEEKHGPKELMGKAAVANAVLAYDIFTQTQLKNDHFQHLVAAGASYQRPLWASTSTKNHAYSDTLYVASLIGPHTVNTMPLDTLLAFGDHGDMRSSILLDAQSAASTVKALEAAHISMEAVTDQLLHEGVASFATSFSTLIEQIVSRIDSRRSRIPRRVKYSLGPALPPLTTEPPSQTIAKRIWSHDPTLWKSDSAHAAIILNRLGWLDVMDAMEDGLPRLLKLREKIIAEGMTDVVLLGMGGSSLCPEVFRSSFGKQYGFPTLHVLDTTDPDTIGALQAILPLETTIFVVASKSGGTLETLSHFAYFHAALFDAGILHPERHFVAVTDPESPLVQLAHDNNFREVFENPPTIGGRYSALSFFGLVPASLMGLDVALILDRARDMADLCNADTPVQSNVGLELGAIFAHARAHGRDKITIVCSPEVRAFSLWAEQLIAESTGKEGIGLIPIGDEPMGTPAAYGSDRLFVGLLLDGGTEDLHEALDALHEAGHPVVSITLRDTYDLAGEFFRWEFATAVAGSYLGIDPFDEPNVKESKDNTARVLTSVAEGELPQLANTSKIHGEHFDVVGAFTEKDVDGALSSFIAKVQPGDYVSFQAYVQMDDTNYDALQSLRTGIRDHLHIATTLGYGPRFLHSTGQLHKGGPNTGVYIQILSDAQIDLPLPNASYSFGMLKHAQANGDFESLVAHDRRVIRIHLVTPTPQALRDVTEHLMNALTVRS